MRLNQASPPWLMTGHALSILETSNGAGPVSTWWPISRRRSADLANGSRNLRVDRRIAKLRNKEDPARPGGFRTKRTIAKRSAGGVTRIGWRDDVHDKLDIGHGAGDRAYGLEVQQNGGEAVGSGNPSARWF